MGPKNATQLKVTILDFGLSRAEVHVGKRQTEVIWTDPDPDIFGGTSAEDYQFECYDLMKKSMEGKKWSEFNPFSTIIVSDISGYSVCFVLLWLLIHSQTDGTRFISLFLFWRLSGYIICVAN